MKKAGIALIGLALVATVLYSVRAPLSTAIMGRTLERNMSTSLLDSLPDGLHVVLCGAGGPLPDPVRSGGCVAVVAGDNLVIVDAGTGGARNLNPMGLPVGQVDAVFLTHFHSDHIDGLGEMATLRWVSAANQEPLPVYGPEGVEEVVAGFNRSYAMDADYRHAHHGDTVAPLSGQGMQAHMHPQPPDGEAVVVYESDGLVVTMIRVEHKPVEPAVAYLFNYKDRSALVSGDTVKSANLQTFARGVDLLVHEGLSASLVQQMNKAAVRAGNEIVAKISADIPDYHTTPVEAAEIARDANVGHLLFYHVVPPTPLPGLKAAWLSGVDAVFERYTLGEDGTGFSLPAGSKDIIAID
ncbi:MAG: MBL fold metallo-hydrolase [Halieaceae bacterium]|jgi:ribonuclease Z|nr:MBL fold metallo-hydrolase [Halieaceae bacterium]